MPKLKAARELIKALASPSLEAITRRLVKRHYRLNPVLNQHGFGPVRLTANWIKSHGWGSFLCGATIYSAVLTIAWAAYPLEIGPHVPADVTDFYRDLQTINLSLLAAQATLVGLVLPIVIALVGLLSGGTISYRGRLNLFIQETEAPLVGASSICLLVAVVFQSLLLNQMPARMGAALTALNIIWFALNIGGIAFFLFQTLRYIQPDLRFDIEKRFVANVVWRHQLTDLVRNNRWRGAQHYEYWPDPKEVVGDEGNNPFILAGAWNRDGDHEIIIEPRQEVEVKDIKIHLIGYIIGRWLNRYVLDAQNNRSVTVEFPQFPLQIVSESCVIVRIKGGPPLTKFESRLMKIAYIFQKPRHRRNFGTVSAFIDETINDLLQLAEQERASEFDTLLRQLTELHGFLFDIAEAPREDETFNYADMQDWPDVSLSIRWARPYRDLHRKVVAKIGAEPDLFASMAWWSPHIVARAKKSAFKAVSDTAMISSSHLLRRLLDWATEDYMIHSGNESGPTVSFEVSPRFKEKYSSAWISFVGSWEGLIDVWKRDFDAADTEWTEFEKHSRIFSEHLIRTAEHVALSVFTGDITAVRWTIDLLLKWPSAALSFDGGGVEIGAVESSTVTTQIFAQSWDEVRNSLQPRYLRGDQLDGWTPDKRSIWDSVFENLANDLQFALVVLLSGWVHSFEGKGQSAVAVRRLLRGEIQDHGWRGGRENVAFTFDEMIVAMLQIASFDDRAQPSSHSSAIADLHRRVNDIGGRRYVSSRIYSGSGSGEVLDAIEAQLIALCARTALPIDNPQISRDAKQLFDHAFDDAARRQMIDHLEKLRGILDGDNADKLDCAINAIRMDSEDTAPQARAALHAMLSAYIDGFENERNEAYAAAPISEARMQEVAEAASSLGFSTETSAFPISVFETVECVAEAHESFTLRATDQNAGEFTDPPFGMRVSNESEYFADVMRRQAAAVVMADAVRQFESQEVAAQTPESFWREILRIEEVICAGGQSPVLIVAAATEPHWLFDWRWPDRYEETWRPENLQLQRNEGMPRGYLFHLNDLPVFVGAIRHGATYLLPLETFERVRFSLFDDIPVTASFERSAENIWKGDLLLKFARDVAVGSNNVYRLKYAEGDPQ